MTNGCAASQPTRFYVLNALRDGPGARRPPCPEVSNTSIGISPVDLPEYLDRPQIMTRKGENELHLSELDVWAAPLEDNIADVLAQDLRSLMCARVETFPWQESGKIGYRVSSTVIHLDGTPGKQAYLDVLWSITDERSNKTVCARESRYAEPVRQDTNEALVSAYSRLIASFSRDIADAFESMRLVQAR